jgi:putative tricarboxylic transport membrane protein
MSAAEHPVHDSAVGDEPPPRAWAGPRVWGLVLLGIAVAVLAATTAIRSPEGWDVTGPRFVPLIVGIALLALALLFLARTFVRRDTELAERAAHEARTTTWSTPAVVLVALLAYAFLLEPLGYAVATTLFVPLVARALGSRAPVRDVIVGAGLGLGLYVAFTQYLGVDLPAGLTPIT